MTDRQLAPLQGIADIENNKKQDVKTIAEIAADHLKITGVTYVMWGDTHVLDEIAWKCTHTNLSSLHPLTRHHRILNALERSPLFQKQIIDISGRGRGNTRGRCFRLDKEDVNP